jgi:hypothetical protein
MEPSGGNRGDPGHDWLSDRDIPVEEAANVKWENKGDTHDN